MEIDTNSTTWMFFDAARTDEYLANLNNPGFDFQAMSNRLAAKYGWTPEQVEVADATFNAV